MDNQKNKTYQKMMSEYKLPKLNETQNEMLQNLEKRKVYKYRKENDDLCLDKFITYLNMYDSHFEYLDDFNYAILNWFEVSMEEFIDYFGDEPLTLYYEYK